jgi:DNA-binding SARP family transcriptional activator
MLVTGRGREFAREQIFDTLWPELTEERAKNNFYVAWSAMKGALSLPESTSGPCPYADNSGGRCRIVVTAVRSDLDDFEESRQAAREAETSGDIDAAIAAYDLLAAAYSGDLMAGDPYDEWIQPLRDRYRTDFVEAMLRLGNLLLERDDPCEALPYLRRAMEVSLYREDVCQAALRCHIAAGQRGAAVDTFMACKSQLSEELGLDPSADTLALYQQILVMEDRPRYDDYGLT